MIVINDLWRFITFRKKWWLFPTIFFLMIIAVFGLTLGGMSIPPIMYALF